MYVCMYVYMYVGMYVRMYVYMYVCMCIRMYIRTYSMYAHAYMCMCTVLALYVHSFQHSQCIYCTFNVLQNLKYDIQLNVGTKTYSDIYPVYNALCINQGMN